MVVFIFLLGFVLSRLGVWLVVWFLPCRFITISSSDLCNCSAARVSIMLMVVVLGVPVSGGLLAMRFGTEWSLWHGFRLLAFYSSAVIVAFWSSCDSGYCFLSYFDDNARLVSFLQLWCHSLWILAHVIKAFAFVVASSGFCYSLNARIYNYGSCNMVCDRHIQVAWICVPLLKFVA